MNDVRRIKRQKPVTEFVIMPKLEPKKFLTQLVAFTMVCATLVSLLQGGIYLSSAKKASGEILGVATTAYTDLNNATNNLTQQNFANAAILFDSASNNVRLAQEKLNDYKPLTWITKQGNSADHILAGAGFLAAAGEKLTQALDLFSAVKVSSEGVENEFNQKIADNQRLLEETRELVYKSEQEFDSVGSVPLDYEETLRSAKQQVKELRIVLDKLIGLEKLYLNIFGSFKTYLLIFQNYDEQRATGGFIGTFGVIKTDQGKITKLKIDSIYDLDGQIYEQVAAPGPFQPEIKRWGIRDANWFADFPTSANKLLYFFEKGGETADGVISMTPKVFEDLLRMVGPIEMPEYDVVLTHENFQDIVQYKTSIDYDIEENEPKKMLADFAPVLLDRLTNLPQEQWLHFFQLMQDNLNQRQIMVYSADDPTQQTIEELGFSGKVISTDHDYLSIINSNLGGTKTDLEMEQTVVLKGKILSDGSLMNTLTISRLNQGDPNNRNYMRVLVPLGSTLISSSGFDEYPMYSSTSEGLRTDPDLAEWDKGEVRSNTFIRTESGKTEFAGWLNVGGGEEKIVTITYMLPFKVSEVHSLYLQKQAGSRPINFKSSLALGPKIATWVSGNVEQSVNSLNFQSNSNTDNFWGFVLE